ncbi:MAG: hypothetical protein KDI56_07010 [Xanthomonadales bacterium]|nr:hypothetical protein [Xanthomonadales bacterium]
MSGWEAVALEELRDLINQSLAQSSAESRRVFGLIQIPPEKWALPPWGDQGGGFWVIAVLGQSAIWYNDIEEGFNCSPFTRLGILDQYACDQLELHHWLFRLNHYLATGKGFPGEGLGAPEAISQLQARAD